MPKLKLPLWNSRIPYGLGVRRAMRSVAIPSPKECWGAVGLTTIMGGPKDPFSFLIGKKSTTIKVCVFMVPGRL